MIDLNEIRKMFAEEMAATSNVRYSFDTALYKVSQRIYQQGLIDGLQQQEKGNDATISKSSI